MLLIEQIFEPDNIRCDYVRCPACGRGRLCDKPIGEKAMAIALKEGSELQNKIARKTNLYIVAEPMAKQNINIYF